MSLTRLILLALLGIGRSLAQLDVATLFNVDFTASANGGCVSIGADTLNGYLQDSLVLAQAGMSLINAYTSNNEEAARLVESFFNNPNAPTALLSSYSAVASFLTSNQAFTGGMPRLFCSSNWLSRIYNGQTLTKSTPAWDVAGNPVPDTNGNPLTLYQVYQTQWDNYNQYANHYIYFSPLLNDFLFDLSYGSPSKTYCSSSLSSGATQDQTAPMTVTLCTRSFTGGRLAVPQVTTTTFEQFQAETAKKAKHTATYLSTLMTAVAPLTLYHELFHLVLGPAATPDTTYEVSDMAGFVYGEAAMAANPETFVAASYAWWLSNNLGMSADGYAVEFYTGYATQG